MCFALLCFALLCFASRVCSPSLSLERAHVHAGERACFARKGGWPSSREQGRARAHTHTFCCARWQCCCCCCCCCCCFLPSLLLLRGCVFPALIIITSRLNTNNTPLQPKHTTQRRSLLDRLRRRGQQAGPKFLRRPMRGSITKGRRALLRQQARKLPGQPAVRGPRAQGGQHRVRRRRVQRVCRVLRGGDVQKRGGARVPQRRSRGALLYSTRQHDVPGRHVLQ